VEETEVAGLPAVSADELDADLMALARLLFKRWGRDEAIKRLLYLVKGHITQAVTLTNLIIYFSEKEGVQ
jgi:hypothetical protein